MNARKSLTFSSIFVLSFLSQACSDGGEVLTPAAGGASGKAGASGKGGAAGATGGSAGTAGTGGSGGAAGKSGAAGKGGSAGAAGKAGGAGAAGAAGKSGAAGAAGTAGAAGKSGAAGAGGAAGKSGAAGAGGVAGKAGSAGASGAGAGGSAAGNGGSGGVVSGATASLSATSVSFGLVDCGTAPAATQTLTVTNTGSAPLTVAAIITGSTDFTLQGDASATIAPGANKAFTVAAGTVPASSTAGSNLQGTLQLTTNDAANAVVQVPITLTPQGATLTLAPAGASFGDVPVNTAGTPVGLVLTNTGNAQVTVAIGTPDDAQFGLSSTGGDLAAGAALPSVLATFTPNKAGAAASKATVTTTGAAICGTSVTDIALSGNGSIGAIGVSGDLDFGSNPCGGAAAAAQTITITNAGNAAFTFDAALGAGATSPYTFEPAAGTVPANGTIVLTVTPKGIPATSPTTDNAFGDTLVITPSGLPDNTPKIVALKQSARGAIVTSSAANVAFSLTPVGTTANAGLTLTNAGNAPIDLSLVVAGGPVFGVTPTTTTVPAAGNQSSSVTFTPPDIAGQTGSLTLQAADGQVLCAPLPDVIALTGQGQNGGVSFDTTTLDFGSVNCGATAGAKIVTLTNTGNAPMTFNASLGKQDSPYTFSPATATVAAGATAQITVTPKAVPGTSPTTDNAFGDELTVLTDVIGDQAHVVSLKQTARGAILAFAPAALGFGSIPAGSPSQKSVQLVNTGNAPASVTLASNSGAFTPSPLAATVPAAGQTGVNVTFAAPPTPGAYVAAVSATIGAGDVLCAPAPANLAVTATSTTGQVSFSPSSLDFGNVLCGKQAAPQQITFTNPGNADYTLSVPTLTPSASYTVTVSPADRIVKANGGTVTITVTPKAIPFPSAVPGAYGATLSVSTNVAGDTPHDFAITETAQGAILALTPVTYNFGSTPIGSNKLIQYTVTNSGNLPATVAIGTGSNAAFSFGSGTVAGGASIQATGTFQPTEALTYNGSGVFSASNTTLCQPLAANTQAMALTGVGAATSTITVAPTSINFGQVGCGTTAPNQNIVISNAGSSAVNYTADFSIGGSDYSVSAPTGTVPANGSVTIQLIPTLVAKTSTPGQSFPATLNITTNDPQNTVRSVTVAQVARGGILNFKTTGGQAFSILGVPRNPGYANYRIDNSGNQSVSINLLLTQPATPLFGFDSNGAGPITVGNGQQFGLGIFYTGPVAPAPLPADKLGTLGLSLASGNLCTASTPSITLAAQ